MRYVNTFSDYNIDQKKAQKGQICET
jgi:hypothetical protein